MDGSDESTGTYPLLSGAAGYAFRTEPSAANALRPASAADAGQAHPATTSESDDASPTEPAAAIDDEPPTEEFGLFEYPGAGPGPQPAIDGPPAPRRSRSMAAVVIGAAVLLGGSALAGYGLVAHEPESAGVAASSRPRPAPSDGERAGAAFASGTFDLAGSVGELNLSLGPTADGPIRVSAPGGAADASVDGSVVRVTTGSSPARLDVTLDERIAWIIRMTGGVRTATFVLTGGTVREVDLSGGADQVSLTLPEVDRALPIRMSGGVGEWSIFTTNEVPVRVRAQTGAGEVTLYGKRERGIARDTTLTAGDGPGLDVTATAGFGSLAVSTTIG